MSILEELPDGGLGGMATDAEKPSPVRSLNRALLILQIVALHEEEPLSLARIARESGLPKPTVHRLAGVLRDSGMLQRDEEGNYLPGPMLLVMGTNYLRKMRLREASRSALVRLHRITSQAVYLAVPQSPWIVNVARIESNEAAPVADPVGSLNPQHTTAGGKVLLAFGDSDGIRRLLASGLTAKTPNSITDSEALLRELTSVFDRGYATEVSENENGVVSVAAPVLNHSRRAVGAIGISGHRTDTSNLVLRSWATELVATAAHISQDLGWTGGAGGFFGNRRAALLERERTVS